MQRIDGGIERFASQFGESGKVASLKSDWAGDRLAFSLKAMGQGITGHIDELDTAINLEIELPAFLGMIADKVRGKLQKEGQVLLEDRSKTKP